MNEQHDKQYQTLQREQIRGQNIPLDLASGAQNCSYARTQGNHGSFWRRITMKYSYITITENIIWS